MKFGIFYEHQLPKPWAEGDELRLFHEALEQVELADRLGIDHAWEVEHHFLEEYSHSSAPEVFLAAASQRTKTIRLGHGICLSPPQYNHPARVAERLATLDLVSKGRVDWGTGESSSLMELGGFRVPVAEKREMWRETVEQPADMMAMNPYPGFEGRYFSMPCRNVVPKPVQKPHPPIWVACSKRETIHLAARCGIGALTFAFVDAAEAKLWVDDYYRILKSECVPIGHAINPNICMVSGFSVHPDGQEARRRGLDGFMFFGFALGHFPVFGEHRPGRTNVWSRYEKARAQICRPTRRAASARPTKCASTCAPSPRPASIKSASCSRAGATGTSNICESLELFARDIQPEFKERAAEREARKMAELAPYLEQAMARKVRRREMRDDEVPSYPALGRQVIAGSPPSASPTLGSRVADYGKAAE